MKAPISLSIIVKNDPALEQCLLSLRDFVEQIVVVDTGSTDGVTQEIAKKYADVFEIYTDCNDPETGLINNFSQARNRALELSTCKWVMWADSDDVVDGAEKLFALLPEFEKSLGHYDGLSVIFPYEYSYDEFGTCNCRHYRERLFLNPQHVTFTNPVHEVAIPKNGSNVIHITSEDIVFKHKRQYSDKPIESGRNLRILKKYVDKIGESDARQFYYIGLEYCNNGMIDESIAHLTRYVELSGWEDEVVMACLKLVDIYQAIGQYDNGLKWAFKAVEKKENWSEGYLALARMYYFLADKGGPNSQRNWEKCVFFAKQGLALPPTRTLLFVNPLEREYDIHRYLNVALNKIGNIQGALDSINTGLLKRPDDSILLFNKKIYETFIAKQEVITGFNKLKDLGSIEQVALDLITGLVNNQIPSEAITFKTSVDPNSIISVVEENSNSIFPQAKVGTWNIPETWDYHSYPLDLSTAQLQTIVIMVWKQYMLHDEVLSAISFLKNAPYNVRHSFATQKALHLTESCLDWMDSKEEFEKVNSPGTIDEAGTPLPQKFVNSAEGHRFDFVANNLAPNSTLVDFGSMDGGYTNRYALLGHKVTGLDGCAHSVSIAKRKAIEFDTGANFINTYFQEAINKVPNGYFDYATSTDTYEHLKDPVHDMLIPAKKMLNENGKFLLATPHGAWMRGQYKISAHPWLWEQEGKSWLQISPRAHLVAPTVWSVTEHFRQAGFWVKDCYIDLCDSSFHDVEGQGNVFVEAYVKSPIPLLDVVFFIGNGVEEWTPQTIKKTGMGGSETMAYNQAKNLAALGHKVRVYSGVGEWGEGIYDGVEYYKSDKYQDLTCDVLIVSRYADKLADHYNIKAKLKLLWVHDVYAISATNELLLKADRILALTQWHKNFIVGKHNVHPDQVIVTRNGIDLSRFNKNVERNKFKCVNSSSPDRSWAILLEIWPQIRAQVPAAELHLYYGFKNWAYSAQFSPGQPELIERLKQHILELESQGVVYHDRVSQEQLSTEFLSSGAWIHPTWFTETSCITAMEAQAAGLRMITSSIGALNETVSNRGNLISGDWTSQEYKNHFIDFVVKALQKDDDSDRLQLQEYASKNFGLQTLAQEWNDMFYNLLDTLKSQPIVPYMPTASYRIK